MEVRYSVAGEKLCFYLCGELDERYAKGVKDYIENVLDESPRASKIIFNMQDLAFMDSTGVGMLLGRYKRLKRQGKECFIESPTPSVEKVIAVSGIYDIMPKI